MKIGIRTPNIKKSIKARTTGRIKRTIKRSVNPIYGKKGMGLLFNPKKSIYNKIYNKTTINILDQQKEAKENSHIKIEPLTHSEIKKKKNAIPVEQQVHYFDKQAICCNCNKNLGLLTFKGRFQLIDGWLCLKCLKRICNNNKIQRKAYTKQDIKLIFKQ